MSSKLDKVISTDTKKRVVFGILLFLGTWPIFHHWLVTQYEMDPWKYFGMSMYVRSRPMIGLMSMEIAYPGESFQEVPLRSGNFPLARPLYEKMLKLIDRRRDYGTLYRPEMIAGEIFEIIPQEIDRLAFTLGVVSLDSEAMLAVQVIRTECHKQMSRSGVQCKVVG